MKENVKQLVITMLLIFPSLFLSSQTKNDTVSYLTNKSKDYLNLIFKKGRIDSAATYWSEHVFDDLKAGYNNGRKNYKNENDLITLFSSDILKFLNSNKRLKKKLLLDGTPMLFDGDGGERFFVINFKFKDPEGIDDSLKNITIDLISRDQGKSWKVNTDQWLNNFLYYLYVAN